MTFRRRALFGRHGMASPKPEALYVDVWIDSIPIASPRPYTYRVPPALSERLRLGVTVLVPFGPRPKVSGYVVAYPSVAPQGACRDLIAVLDQGVLPPALQELLQWVADYYVCSVAQVYQMALPRGSTSGAVKEKTQLFATLSGGLAADLSSRQSQVLEVLSSHGGQMTLKDLVRTAKTSPDLLRALETKGAIAIASMRVWRRPDAPLPDPADCPEPTAEQTMAIQAITQGPPGDVFLLHGVTGSGKTEVYLRTIADTLAKGQQALVLVPEIALTPQTVARFSSRFGNRVAVLHSALGEGERYDEWERLRTGEARVGIGARSAIFAPVSNLGLIILDEEHEGSYKQDTAPRYHARHVALKRGELEGARILLGSATPSVESFQRARSGDYHLLTLSTRIHDRPLPPVEVVDMRAELEAGHRSIFSRAMKEAMCVNLEHGEQTILLINRRGYATFVLCRSCGEAVRCPSCSVSLTYHRTQETLRCHYCDHREPMPKRCPSCQSPYIKHFGAGSQQVAEAAAQLLPEARILRLDRDATSRKDDHRRILESFAKGEADILVGTQMVAKGLDLPRVTLVGIMAADSALNLPDFRSAERTFQLLTQVAGRAGRGKLPGRVVLQTYAPEHSSIQLAQHHDYAGFFENEIMDREALNYPPFVQLINLMVSAPEFEPAWAVAYALSTALTGHAGLTVLGPAEAAIAQIRGRYRVQLLLKTTELAESRQQLRDAVRAIDRPSNVRLAIDVDPVSLL